MLLLLGSGTPQHLLNAPVRLCSAALAAQFNGLTGKRGGPAQPEILNPNVEIRRGQTGKAEGGKAGKRESGNERSTKRSLAVLSRCLVTGGSRVVTGRCYG